MIQITPKTEIQKCVYLFAVNQQIMKIFIFSFIKKVYEERFLFLPR